MVVASILTLCLFGVIYDKFSTRTSVLVFAKSIMARRLPASSGGFVLLTIRLANLENEYLVNPDLRVMAIKRSRMPNGDGIIMHHTGVLMDLRSAGVPPVVFLHHVVNEASPFFDAASPAQCNFESTVRIIVGVTGHALGSQCFHSGMGDWGTDQIVLDADFVPMHSAQKHEEFNYSAFNLSAPVKDIPESAKLASIPLGLDVNSQS